MSSVIERKTAPAGADAVPAIYRLRPGFIPKSRYLAREWLELELEKLFPHTWLMACREEDIHDAGDYYEYVIGDQSILVVRQPDRSIKAFYNACRHRGTRLANGCGHAGEIRCPFHGWRWH